MRTENINSMKFKCKDVAFLLIVRFDSIDRLENTLAVTDYLVKNFDTNIYLWEFASFENGIFCKLKPDSVNYVFCHDENPILHRTKFLNKMVKIVNEKYVSIWDVDVIAPVPQVTKAVELLRDGIDFVLPYEKVCYDTSMEIRKLYFQERDIDVLLQNTSFMTELYPPNPVGGAFFAKRQAYIHSGLEREQFYGWGIEDGERYRRWHIQKQKVERVEGPLFHLTHSRGINSVMPFAESQLTKRRIYNLTLKTESWKNL